MIGFWIVTVLAIMFEACLVLATAGVLLNRTLSSRDKDEAFLSALLLFAVVAAIWGGAVSLTGVPQ